MSKTGQPNLPELRIYYVGSTRLDVHLVSSKNPSKTMMDKSPKYYFAILRNSLNSFKDGRTGQFAQHLIQNITSRVWIWLKGFPKFLRSFSPSAFRQTALKQETIPHHPYLVYVTDPFTHLIVGVYVATGQKEAQ
ncbi:hypothetical protein H6G89_33555 [Oscillatoria sp. FACHB-1407]|uniref:hypothetical protein n=1 Tax=Oscillatoria sp. FACHB-1407 TaxID=2692847 RepID=UPI0016885250|nr:hypothetical protein [Oscillatoria sp. FACHB-1407]MBD2465915.1 hypothetical protein [Oscillatoria sp. FACHB-1407]